MECRAGNRQWDTPEVPRLPRKMTTEISKMLSLPRKLQLIVETTQKYCACHIKRPSTRCQTGWNVTKCRACHAKRHDNLLGNLRDTERPQENQRLETRHVGASKRAFRARIRPIFTLCSFKNDVFLRVFL